MKLRSLILISLVPGLQVSGQVAADYPHLTLRILDSAEVQLGDRSIIYQRVAPPALPTLRAAAPAPSPAAVAADFSAAPRAVKQNRALFLSATVDDRGFTELRGWDRQGEFRAISNVDFNLLAGVTEIETPDTVWLLFLNVVNGSRNPDAEHATSAPSQRLSPNRAEYSLVAAPSPPDGASLSALDALHVYFDTNRTRLLAEHAQREATRAAPPTPPTPPAAPQDTVIQYWPQKSRVYAPTAR